MSSKQAAVKKPALVAGAAVQTATGETKPKAPRKPKVAALSMPQRFALMQMVKEASPTEPDSALAARASAHFGRAIQQQTVAEYRKQFGLASVRKPSPAALAAYVELLKERMGEHGIEVPAMPQQAADEPQAAPEGGGSDGTSTAG